MEDQIFTSNKNIKWLYWPDDSASTVGVGGLLRIKPYHENGQMSPVLWFKLTYTDGAVRHFNSVHVQGVGFEGDKS